MRVCAQPHCRSWDTQTLPWPCWKDIIRRAHRLVLDEGDLWWLWTFYKGIRIKKLFLWENRESKFRVLTLKAGVWGKQEQAVSSHCSRGASSLQGCLFQALTGQDLKWCLDFAFNCSNWFLNALFCLGVRWRVRSHSLSNHCLAYCPASSPLKHTYCLNTLVWAAGKWVFGRRRPSLLQNLWSSFPFGIQSDILDQPSSPDVLKARCAV